MTKPGKRVDLAASLSFTIDNRERVSFIALVMVVRVRKGNCAASIEWNCSITNGLIGNSDNLWLDEMIDDKYISDF
jgi:hypothetical protein